MFISLFEDMFISLFKDIFIDLLQINGQVEKLNHNYDEENYVINERGDMIR